MNDRKINREKLNIFDGHNSENLHSKLNEGHLSLKEQRKLQRLQEIYSKGNKILGVDL